MTKKKAILLSILVILLGIIAASGSYALWSWNSNTNKNFSFNIAKGLENYIVYDAGESKFVGSLEPTSSYTDGMHATISFYKTGDAVNVPLVAAINMQINSIGDNIKESRALKWKLTLGDSTNVGATLSEGNFMMRYTSNIYLANNIEVQSTLTKYTIWIWLDDSENISDSLSGESLDTYIYTNITQAAGVYDSRYITNVSIVNQNVTFTIMDNTANITKYALSTTSDKLTADSNLWVEIPLNKQSSIYVVNETVAAVGTYYASFMDASGFISDPSSSSTSTIQVTSVDISGPSCTFGPWSRQYIGSGENATITLTCTDAESKISKYNLKTSDITTSNNYITVSKVNMSAITNGYSYTITVTGTDGNNLSHITLPANKVKNLMEYDNATDINSGDIHLTTTYQITLNNANATTNGTSVIYERYGRGFYLDNGLVNRMSTIINPITIPQRTGYSFAGYYDDSTQMIKGDGTLTSNLTTTQYSASKTLTASWVDDIPPSGTLSLSYNNPTLTVTVTATDNGGTGIKSSSGYGYKLSTDSTCDSTTTGFETQTGNSHGLTVSSTDPQYVCVRVEDNSNNFGYISATFTPS